MNIYSQNPAFLVMRALLGGHSTWGENTWNQVTSTSTLRADGANNYIIRLHIGSQIDRSRHKDLIRYLQVPGSEANRQKMQELLASIYCKDHPVALIKLGLAVEANLVTNWQFSPFGDVNHDGGLYRIDISTEADIKLQDLLEIQLYLETRQGGRGREALAEIFKGRKDATACEILDLND